MLRSLMTMCSHIRKMGSATSRILSNVIRQVTLVFNPQGKPDNEDKASSQDFSSDKPEKGKSEKWFPKLLLPRTLVI